MKKKYLSLTLLLSVCLQLSADPIDRVQAEKIARTFISQKTNIGKASLMAVSAEQSMKRINGSTATDLPFHIFNVGDQQGFVIVAADDRATPVLGYSDCGSFDWNQAPDNLVAWMKINAEYVNRCRSNASTAPQVMHAGTPVGEPLLNQIEWGQGEPYNLACPTYFDGSVQKNYYVGCVATASTQIMKYYNYPAKGKGTKSYTSNNKTLTADFGNTTYDWANILNSYDGVTPTEEQKQAIATLSAHFGIAVEMEYMKEGSGAMSSLVPTALKDYFGYAASTTLRKRTFYSTDEWMRIIKAEIDAKRPVYYAATSEDRMGGHAFVCDGYDTEDFVHINWGWYGRYNGYFIINHLEPSQVGEGGGSGSYNIDQEIVTGIQPASAGSIEAGEWPLYNSLHLRYYEGENDISLMGTFENFDTRAFTGDVAAVYVVDGKIEKVLKTEAKNIAGFAGRRSGYEIFSMKGVPNTVEGIADGEGFLQMAFRVSGNDAWQFMRTSIDRDRNGVPYGGRLRVKVAGGKITITGADNIVPDVTVLGKLAPEDATVYAKGAVIYPVKLRNDSRHMNLENIVLRFTSTADASKVYDYENEAHVYEGATESLRLLINLADDMEAGEYKVTAYEKGFPGQPFKVEEGDGKVTVQPASAYPVLRLTQQVLWSNPDGESKIMQGQNLYVVLNARNYAVKGDVGVRLYLTDVNNEENSYLFQQQNSTIGQGEAQTFKFYTKLAIDPGTYRIDIQYVRSDGSVINDDRAKAYDTRVEVSENTADIMLNAVAVNIPDVVYLDQNNDCSITMSAPREFKGTLYLRVRQFTLTKGEMIYMYTKGIGAGEEKKLDFKYKPGVEAGDYILLVEAKNGSTVGTVGQYKNCYKLFKVMETNGVLDIDSNDNMPAATVVDGRVVVSHPQSFRMGQVEVYDTDGHRVMLFDGAAGGSPLLPGNGIYIVRIHTDKGTFTRKVIQ